MLTQNTNADESPTRLFHPKCTRNHTLTDDASPAVPAPAVTDLSDEPPTLFYSPVASTPIAHGDTHENRTQLAEADALDRLGYVALGSGRLDEAELHFQAALKARQEGGPAAHEDLPQAFGRLGLVATVRRDLPRARTLFELGLELARAIHQRLTAMDAMLLHNLGCIARARGVFNEAEDYFRGALGIKRTELGPAHPSVATTMASLGAVYLHLDCDERALALFQEARQIFERTWGGQSSGLARVLVGEGRVYLNTDRAAAAEARLRRALEIQEALLTPAAQLGRTRFLLARALFARDPVEARLTAERALLDHQCAAHPQSRATSMIRTWLEEHTSHAA